ncbi:GTPase HflX [Corynebacterium amycolatum]|uniref:GTPase HflX n=1 Tax=Corynebacterium amycolatum TaxID=43765 RepID=UPI000185C47D|nr:GTPase HflX [Corynebacterium amycolatum]EEB64036.1 GTP-binding protein HflX [Corynebacterium amycolatum SK46]
MTNFSNNFDEVSDEMSQQASTSHEMDDFLIDANDAGENADSASGDAFATNVGTQREPTVGDLDLEARSSLRRLTRSVAHTESEEAMVEYRQLRLERVVLLGVWTSGTLQEAEVAMEELAALAETAGSEVLEMVLQRRDKPDPGTYVGSGKLNELRDIVASTGADTVICDGELSPGQLVALEDRLDAKVIDRTMLILDIFAQHAKSKEGKAQVSLAQMQYLYTRLRGWGGNLSRQAGGRAGSNGGVGLRGPGETKIETDRRRLRQDMARIRKELAGMKTAREIKRARRKAGHLPRVAIVGYTNAGKSSLLNALTDAGVLVEDALFATLDPTTRRTKLRDGRTVIMTDTVGFVRHLPTQLIEAFRSTLEEVLEADVIMHVVDSSDPFPLDQIKAVNKVINEIAEEEKAEIPPELLVVNKVDKADGITLAQLRHQLDDAVFVSARTGEGIGELETRLELALNELESHVHMLIPYDKGNIVSMLHEDATVLSETWTEQGTQMDVRLPTSLADELSAYHIEPAADTDFTADANEESSIDS